MALPGGTMGPKDIPGMATSERRAAVMQNSRAKNLWYAVLALQGLGVLNLIYATVVGASKADVTGSALLLGLILPVAAILLSLWILWGVYKFEGWVTFWMWLAVVFAVLTLDLIAITISLFVVLSYRHVRKVAKGGAAPAAPTSPPPPPAAPA